MSAVQVIGSSAKLYPNSGRYFIFEGAAGRHKATVLVVDGLGHYRSYVQVIVQNASNRAWRGMGRLFKDAAEAIGHYHTPEIRDIITAALEAAKDPK